MRPGAPKGSGRGGRRFSRVELHDGEIALPEFLEDLAARGILTLMVEGGAFTARMFLAEGLVDRLALFTGPSKIGAGGIAAPLDRDHIPEGFRLLREARFGDDVYLEYVKGE